MSFPVFKLQSKNRAFNLRPLIEPHVRVPRMLLSFHTLGKFNQKASQIPTIIGHANPLWFSRFGPHRPVPQRHRTSPSGRRVIVQHIPPMVRLRFERKTASGSSENFQKKFYQKCFRYPPYEGHPATVGFCIIQAVGGCF